MALLFSFQKLVGLVLGVCCTLFLLFGILKASLFWVCFLGHAVLNITSLFSIIDGFLQSVPQNFNSVFVPRIWVCVTSILSYSLYSPLSRGVTLLLSLDFIKHSSVAISD